MANLCRILVCISGNGSNLQAIIDQCHLKKKGNIVGVISNNADAYGLIRAHHAEIDTSCVIAAADETRASYDARLQHVIDKYQPDLIVLAGFMRILTDELVLRYHGKMLNIHPSLLPKYQGLDTHSRAIAAKETEHGASVHFVTPQLDSGPVVIQAKVPVFADDTPEILALRVQEQEHGIYPLVINWFCENRLKLVQNQVLLDDVAVGANGYAPD